MPRNVNKSRSKQRYTKRNSLFVMTIKNGWSLYQRREQRVCRFKVVWIALSGSFCFIKKCSGYRDITPKPESSVKGTRWKNPAASDVRGISSTFYRKPKICFPVQGSRPHGTAKVSVMWVETKDTRAFAVKCNRGRIFRQDVTEDDDKIDWVHRVLYLAIDEIIYGDDKFRP